MTGEKNDIDEKPVDETTDDSLTATVVITEDDVDDIPGDSTAEVNIERLVAKLDASDSEAVHKKAEVRKKVEELREQREKELDSTFNFNLDED